MKRGRIEYYSNAEKNTKKSRADITPEIDEPSEIDIDEPSEIDVDETQIQFIPPKKPTPKTIFSNGRNPDETISADLAVKTRGPVEYSSQSLDDAFFEDSHNMILD